MRRAPTFNSTRPTLPLPARPCKRLLRVSAIMPMKRGYLLVHQVLQRLWRLDGHLRPLGHQMMREFEEAAGLEAHGQRPVGMILKALGRVEQEGARVGRGFRRKAQHDLPGFSWNTPNERIWSRRKRSGSAWLGIPRDEIGARAEQEPVGDDLPPARRVCMAWKSSMSPARGRKTSTSEPMRSGGGQALLPMGEGGCASANGISLISPNAAPDPASASSGASLMFSSSQTITHMIRLANAEEWADRPVQPFVMVPLSLASLPLKGSQAATSNRVA